MTIHPITKNGVTCAVIESDAPVITDVGSALDVLMSAKYEAGTENIVIAKEQVTENFFILSRGLALKLGEKVPGELSERIDKHIEAAAVGHADDALLDAEAHGLLEHGVHGGNERLAALKAEALLPDVLGAEMPLEGLCRGEMLKNADAARSVKVRSRARPLELGLPPALLFGIGDMHVFDCERAAISLAQRLHQRVQRHRRFAE